jgi:hypothetical protein
MIRLPQSRTGRIAAAVSIAALGLARAHAAAPPQDAAAAKAKPEEVSIPFANHGGIRDWRADGDRGIWVQDIHNKWYYGRFMSPCIGLQFAEAVRFRTGPAGELDRWGAVRARNTGNCVFTSFVRSDGPPKKSDRKLKAGEPAPATPAAPAPTAPAKPPASASDQNW